LIARHKQIDISPVFLNLSNGLKQHPERLLCGSDGTPFPFWKIDFCNQTWILQSLFVKLGSPTLHNDICGAKLPRPEEHFPISLQLLKYNLDDCPFGTAHISA